MIIIPHAHRLDEQTSGAKMTTSENSLFHRYKSKKKIVCQSLQFRFNRRTLKNVHNSCAKVPITSYICSLDLAPK